MGQYHKLVNLDKEEVVHPHDLGLGLKQYEHAGFEGSLSDALYLLVMSSPASGGGDFPLTEVSGRWCGDRVIILGDYTENIPGVANPKALYSASDTWEDITAEVREAFTKIFAIEYAEKDYGKWKSWQRHTIDA